MGRRLGAWAVAAALAMGCEAGVVGQPPPPPPAMPSPPPARSEPAPPAEPTPEPLPLPESRQGDAVPGPQRPDAVSQAPQDAPAAPPAPLVWRRVDITEFSVELPMPIGNGTLGDTNWPWFGSRLGPLELSAGELRVSDGPTFVSTGIRGLMKDSPGTVAKRDVRKFGKGGEETIVVIHHVNGALTFARYVHVPFTSGSGWLLWQVAVDASGRADRPEMIRFVDSLRPVQSGTVVKPKAQKR